MASTMRSSEDIDEQVDLAMETQDSTRWPAMSYEAGVSAALRWITGETDDPPMED